jgi:sugar/nucleoside kinase (ribokinase family)
MMEKAGMDTGHIKVINNVATLFSVCYQYPDHSGGNITSANSASNLVQPQDIDAFFDKYTMNGEKGIVLAAPEVPLIAQIRMLEHGKNHGMLNVASVVSSNMEEFEQMKGFELTDLLAINIDEAQRIAKIEGNQPVTQDIVHSCTSRLEKVNPEIRVLITDGSRGSYCYYKRVIEFTPSLKTTVVSTAGAGDAFLSGTISGLCCGLPLFKGISSTELNEFPLQTAVELGTVLASFSVTSADTIHEGASSTALYNYIQQSGLQMTESFENLFN